jgi:glucosamine--fructose-6-phosphate aminotransferase (isomerizing)
MDGYIGYAEARASQADALAAAVTRLGDAVRAHQGDGGFRRPGPIFLGIGASLAAACAPVWVLRSRGIHSWRLSAGDYPLPFPASVHPVVAVSQSGRSTETLAALDSLPPELRHAVVNTDPSPLTAAVRSSLSLGNIPDSYASTIGFTATVTALGMIADAWDGGDIDPHWHQLPQQVRDVDAALGARAAELAAAFDGAPWADFIGSGPSAGSAEAAALLFREVARVPSSGLSTRTYLHGSMESASPEGVHVLFGAERELEVARMLTAAGDRVILVTGDDVPESDGLHVITLPKAAPAQRAVLEAVAMQVLVEAVARARGVEIEEFVFFHDDTKVAPPAEAP